MACFGFGNRSCSWCLFLFLDVLEKMKMTPFWQGFMICWALGWLCAVLGMLAANAEGIHPMPGKFLLAGATLLLPLWPLALVRGVEKMMGN